MTKIIPITDFGPDRNKDSDYRFGIRNRNTDPEYRSRIQIWITEPITDPDPDL